MKLEKGTILYQKSFIGNKLFVIRNCHKDGTYTVAEYLNGRHYGRLKAEEILKIFEIGDD
jgi:hypothetical protein